MIFRSEDLFDHGEAMTAQLLRWSSPNYAILPRIVPHHYLTKSRNLDPMSASTRTLLTEFFAPYNARLEDRLGTKMNWPVP